MKMVKIPYWMAEKIRDYCVNSYNCDFCIFGGKCWDCPEDLPDLWELDEICVEDEDDG